MKDISFLYNSIIAHRGIYDNKKIFENSIQSFKKALRYNIPIELDIHLLKDNTIIVFHDKNLKRITGLVLIKKYEKFSLIIQNLYLLL